MQEQVLIGARGADGGKRYFRLVLVIEDPQYKQLLDQYPQHPVSECRVRSEAYRPEHCSITIRICVLTLNASYNISIVLWSDPLAKCQRTKAFSFHAFR